MTDRKPPRIDGDERSTLVGLWQYHRESFAGKLDGISETQARWSPVPTGTSLLGLAQHLAYAEQLWVLQRFAGRDLASVGPDLRPGDSVASALPAYRATWAAVDAVVASSSLDDRCRNIDEGEPPQLRWVVAHLLEETARHAGHADIIRELIDGQTGR